MNVYEKTKQTTNSNINTVFVSAFLSLQICNVRWDDVRVAVVSPTRCTWKGIYTSNKDVKNNNNVQIYILPSSSSSIFVLIEQRGSSTHQIVHIVLSTHKYVIVMIILCFWYIYVQCLLWLHCNSIVVADAVASQRIHPDVDEYIYDKTKR